jgi:hypothetical protein
VVAFTKCFDEVVVTEQIRDTCITNLEDTTTTFNKTFVEWRPEVDSSITSVKLELLKLTSIPVLLSLLLLPPISIPLFPESSEANNLQEYTYKLCDMLSSVNHYVSPTF